MLSLGSQVGFKLIGFGIIALLARTLAQDDFGRLTLALSICTLGVLLTDLGYSNNAIRKIASNPESALEQAGLVISLRLPLLILFVIGINLMVWLSKPEILPITLGIALSVAFKDLYRSFAAVFIARRRISRNIVSFGIGQLVVLAGVAFASYRELGLAWIVMIYIGGGAATLLISAGQFQRLVGPIVVSMSIDRFRRHAFSAFLLFSLTALNYTHFAIDNIALGYLRPFEEVAKYAAAAQLLEASQFAIRPLTQIMFPICALLCVKYQWVELTRMLGRMYAGALMTGIAAWFFVMLLSDQIIVMVFSSRFHESAAILRILYASVPGLLVTSVGVFVLASLNRERQACIILGVGLIIKLIFLPFVIPQNGPVGVAWLNFFTQSLIACWLVFDSYRVVAWRQSTGDVAPGGQT